MLLICKHNIIRGLYSLQIGNISSISDKQYIYIYIQNIYMDFANSAEQREKLMEKG
jgi:hypothetical protein